MNVERIYVSRSRDSDVQEDGEGSVEEVVTYDNIILAEIKLDGCSRWSFGRRSVLDSWSSGLIC